MSNNNLGDLVYKYHSLDILAKFLDIYRPHGLTSSDIIHAVKVAIVKKFNLVTTEFKAQNKHIDLKILISTLGGVFNTDEIKALMKQELLIENEELYELPTEGADMSDLLEISDLEGETIAVLPVNPKFAAGIVIDMHKAGYCTRSIAEVFQVKESRVDDVLEKYNLSRKLIA